MKVDEKRLLTEATAVNTSTEALSALAAVCRRLSETFQKIADTGTIDGDGDVPEILRKAEVAIQVAKNKIKVLSKSKKTNSEDLDLASGTKKIFGELAGPIKRVQIRIAKEIIPALNAEVTPVSSSTDTMFHSDEEDADLENVAIQGAPADEEIEDAEIPEVPVKGKTRKR